MGRKILLICGFLLYGYLFCFEKDDLQRMKMRMDFYEKGNYAIGIPKFDKNSQFAGDLTLYYISKTFYDPVFHMYFRTPIKIADEDEKIIFSFEYSKLELSPDGVTFQYERKFPEESGDLIFCSFHLSPVRFDDSISYRKTDRGWESYIVRPYEIVKREIKNEEMENISKFSKIENINPTYIIKTEEGLWTLWEFNVKTSGIKSTFSPDATLLIPSGGEGPSFYNIAKGIEKDAYLNFKLKLKIIEDEKFPIPIPSNKKLTLLDTHAHRTIKTDLRDVSLMARKHGFKFVILSILYDEKPYRRLFLGDEDMFDAIKRYPDVFFGFGLIQLNSNGYPGFPRKGPDTPIHVVELWEKGCKGIKILEKWSDVDVSDERFDPIYREIEKLRMPIVFHTNPEGSGCANTKVAKVAEKFPSIPVIMAHLYNEEQLEKTIPYLKKLPNLYIQHMHLSFVKTKDGKTALKRLIEEGLAEKIIFGSDVQDDYSGLIKGYHDFLNELKNNGLSEKTIEKILYKTAEEIISNVKTKEIK